jgi:hypothetical protein
MQPGPDTVLSDRVLGHKPYFGEQPVINPIIKRRRKLQIIGMTTRCDFVRLYSVQEFAARDK